MTAKTVVQEWLTEIDRNYDIAWDEMADLEHRIEAYAEARVAGLREALEDIITQADEYTKVMGIARDALAATPSRLVRIGYSRRLPTGWSRIFRRDEKGSDAVAVYRLAGEGNE